MALVVVWNAAAPAEGDDPRQGAAEMRNIRAGAIERALQGGIYWENSGTIDQNAGKIVTGVQGIGLKLLRFYEDDKTTVMAEWDSTAAARKLTLGDGKTGVRPYKIICNEIDCNTFTASTAATFPATAAVFPIMAYTASQTIAAGGVYNLPITMPAATSSDKVLLLMSADTFASGGEVNSLQYKFIVDRGTGSFVDVPQPNGGGSNIIWSVEPQTTWHDSTNAHQVDDLGSTNAGVIKYAIKFTNTDGANTAEIRHLLFTALNLANA